MKKIAIIAVATIALASCSNEILLDDVKDSAIPFTFDVFADQATKANQENNKTNLDYFYTTFNVNGWKKVDGSWIQVFNNVTNEYFKEDKAGLALYTSSKPSEEWGNIQSFPAWYYENVRYFDKFATDYQFSAYAPVAAQSEINCTDDGKITIGATTAVTVESTNLMSTPAEKLLYTGFSKDYMTATSSAKESGVSLVFAHKLAKFDIKVVATDGLKTKQEVKLVEVTIKNLNGTSSYASDKETETSGYVSGWVTPTTEKLYTVKPEGGYMLNGTSSISGKFILESLMIPQVAAHSANASQLGEQDEACIYVEYTIGSETFKGHYALANIFHATDALTLAGGNEYILTLNIGPKPIYFTTEVTPWAETEKSLDVE